jgi:heme/copper-type cytochrome/quinol oxidase subunit 2
MRSRLPAGKMTDVARVVVFWVAAIICVVAELAILRSIFAPRRTLRDSQSPIADSPRATEMLWGVIPAIALTLLLAVTWRAIR